MTRVGDALPVGPATPAGRLGSRSRRGGAVLVGLGLAAAGLIGILSGGGSGAQAPAALNAPTATPEQARAARQTLASLPLRFERNVGQTDAQVRYLARGEGFALFLTAREAVISLTKPGTDGPRRGSSGDEPSQRAVVRMRLAGANPKPAIAPAKPLAAKSNYFIGSERHVGVSNYREVTYSGVYPGIDVAWHGRQGRFEYDFVVAPGADPSKIALNFKGAERMSIDPRGDLLLKTAAGTLRQPKPVVYQRTGGGRRAVAGRYVVLGDRRVGFRLGAYDRSRALVIDPVITYSTYAGGTSAINQDQAADVAIDSSGNAYITGRTDSSDFPTTVDSYERNLPTAAVGGGGMSTFVTKVDTTASGAASLVYSTYLGGSLQDEGQGIAVDGSGNAYVTGFTLSADFPTRRALPGTSCGVGGAVRDDAFVTKLNPIGSGLVYSTCLTDGLLSSAGQGIAVDTAGSAYVTGQTRSAAPVTAGAFQSVFGGGRDAFVAKLQPSASSGLAYATLLGGAGNELGADIAADGSGNAYVMGSATAGFPTTAGAFQPANAGGSDAFAAKVDTTASGPGSLMYSTFLGGSGSDTSFASHFSGPPAGGIAVKDGNAYVTGPTSSTDFPTQGPLQAAAGGGGDAFVAKLNTAGSALDYSTYLGGSDFEESRDIAVDSAGSAHVLGGTSSSGFPLADPLPGAACPAFPNQAAFVSKLSPAGSSLSYSTCIAGLTMTSAGGGIAVDAAGSTYAAGTTGQGGDSETPDMEVVNGFQEKRITARDAFLVKLAPDAGGRPRVSSLAPRGGPTSGETRVVIRGERFAGTTAVSFDGTPGVSFTVDSPTQITAIAPAHAAGTAHVTVTNTAGSSPARAARGAFSYGEGGWEATASIPTARRVGHTATLLANGKVLVAGGTADCASTPCPILSEAELYDPQSGTWASTASMATPRNWHTAALLPDGRVLVAGGLTNGAPSTPIKSAEIYNPATGSWSPSAEMGAARSGHTATLLPSGPASLCGVNCGKVLVVGGGSTTSFGQSNTTELYNPATNTWAPTGLLAANRTFHTAAALPTGPASVCGSRCGRVLVSGGFHAAGASPSELYDPLVGTWSAPSGGPAGGDRTAISSRTLANGRVVAAGGGCFEAQPPVSKDSQMFDPAAGTWAPTGALQSGRASHASAQLPSGRMLVAGGFFSCQGSFLSSAEVFDPGVGPAGGYRPAGAMEVERSTTAYIGGPTATLLSSDPSGFAASNAVCGENCGRVLIVGGTASRAAELYTPPPIVSGVSGGDGSTAGGTAVTITGMGLNNGLRAVRFGGVPAASFTADSYGQITALSPAHAAGTADVTVVTEGGEARRSNAFTFNTPTPPSPPSPPGEEPPPVTPPLSVPSLATLADVLAPSVTGFGLTSSRFAVGSARTPISGRAAQVRRGTTLRYTLSEAASVRIVIVARRSGRRSGGRCVAPTRRLRRARTCTRLTTRGALTRTSRAGANRVAFSGRIGSRALRPGRYEARLTATDAARNASRPRTIAFRIVRR